MQNKTAHYSNFDPLRFSLPPTRAPEDRQRMVAKAAYFLAERRHFQPGHELEDWLAAEAEVDRRPLMKLEAFRPRTEP
ncbi:MAG: DUF2934 domain-containing protein [Steroidobacteraceae bacterium]